MKKVKQTKGKLPLLLITAILILCAGFFIVSCGSDPELKGVIADLGAYAVDFDKCPGDYCYSTADADPNSTGAGSIPDIGVSAITFEGWIKKSTTTAVNGTVFSRLDNSRGAVLYVKADEPKFAIRVELPASSGPTPTAPYIVGSNFTLLKDAWTHIAGVIANTAHTHTATSDCTTTVMAETPHLDIYVNGAFKNCATTWGDSGDAATEGQFADNPGGTKIVVGNLENGVNAIDTTIASTTKLNAAIDEIRFWTTGRTADEILACMNMELGFSGTCSRSDLNLAAYYRLNEGTGSILTDFAGNGYASGLSYRDSDDDEHTWEDAYDDGAWISGATKTDGVPITSAD